MTQSEPDNDAPVALRPATQLSAAPAPRVATPQAPVQQVPTPGPAPEPLREDAAPALPASGDDDVTVPALALSGVLLLAGGWLVRRRRQNAGRPQVQPEAAVRVAPADVPGEPVQPAEPPEPWAPDSNIAYNSSWAAATAPASPRRAASRMSVAAQKRLIRWLMWLRTVTRAVAILAAIAVVVFWAIEAIDRRSGESGLTVPLLVVLLAGWAMSWSLGVLANALHRSFFGRVHPKFDT